MGADAGYYSETLGVVSGTPLKRKVRVLEARVVYSEASTESTKQGSKRLSKTEVNQGACMGLS